MKAKHTPAGNAPDGKFPVPVLLMARELNLGGVERDVAKIATHLDRNRFEPHVSTFYPFGFRYEELKAAGIPVVHFPAGSLFARAVLPAAVRMWRYVKKHKIRVVHSYDASGIFGALVAQMARVPVVITSQLSYRDILDAPTQKLLRFSDRFADALLVNCDAIRRYMIQDEHIDASMVELVYNGVDTTTFYPAPEPKPEELAGSSLVIGTVCVLRPEKGLPLLQEAFAKVAHLKPGMKLAIVGSGRELEHLRENAERLGIAGSSVFSPATPDVARWLRTFDIFVLPSYSEAFSNSLLEAMACGCGVIGSRVGGTPELIGDNERGLMFERGDASDLAARLSTLIENEDLRWGLGARAAAFAAGSLSIEIAAERTAAMYERLLSRSSAEYRTSTVTG